MKTRRGFFGALAGMAAGVVGVGVVKAPAPTQSDQRFAELLSEVARLKRQMDQPIVLTMHVNGQAMHQVSVSARGDRF